MELPAEGELGHVLSQVLHAPSWAQADEVLDALQLDRGWVIAPVNESYPATARARVLPLSHLAEIWTP